MRQDLVKHITFSYLIFCIVQVICFTILGLFLILIHNEPFSSSYVIGFFSFIVYTLIFSGLFNTLFLFLLYLLKIDAGIIFDIKRCFVESVFYFALYFIFGLIIDSVPANLKFYYHDIWVDGNLISKNAYTLKFYFTDEARIIFVYIVLTLYYCFKYIRSKKSFS